MKRPLIFAALVFSILNLVGCQKSGNNYHVYFKVLRQNTKPAEGFNVDAWVIGKSEPQRKATNADGMIEFVDLPTPDSQHQLKTILHYYTGKRDQEREIEYPFIPSDAKRLKDTQYIPNNATPEAQH